MALKFPTKGQPAAKAAPAKAGAPKAGAAKAAPAKSASPQAADPKAAGPAAAPRVAKPAVKQPLKVNARAAAKLDAKLDGKPQPAAKAPPRRDSFLGNPWRWLRRFFRRPLRLKRQGLDFKVVLDAPAPDSALAGPRMSPSDTADIQAMRLELGAVLDRDPRSRRVLVHLNMLERALKSSGMKAFEDLPPELLRKAMAQLDTLVMDWSARGLTLLRAGLRAPWRAPRCRR